jgi:hypothetical protein
MMGVYEVCIQEQLLSQTCLAMDCLALMTMLGRDLIAKAFLTATPLAFYYHISTPLSHPRRKVPQRQ